MLDGEYPDWFVQEDGLPDGGFALRRVCPDVIALEELDPVPEAVAGVATAGRVRRRVLLLRDDGGRGITESPSPQCMGQRRHRRGRMRLEGSGRPAAACVSSHASCVIDPLSGAYP